MAKLLPYNSKYYGTEIDFDDGRISLCVHDFNSGASPRELEFTGCKNQEEWLEYISATGESHYETMATYDLAIEVLEVVEKLGYK